MRKAPFAGTTISMDDLSLLRLQIEWGADEALEDSPVDRLRPLAPPPTRAPRVEAARAMPERAQAAVGTPGERALAAASKADTLDALKAAIGGLEGDPLRDMATNLVFASGDPHNGLLLVGGPPGADDDRSGLPFSGPEGALLDRMLASVDLKRDAMLLAPLIPWRPPGGRVPNPGELQLYRPFLVRLIALTAPERIVFWGAMAASTVLGAPHRSRTIGWADGKIDGQTAKILVLPVLSDILKTPARRKDAWTGLRALRRALDA